MLFRGSYYEPTRGFPLHISHKSSFWTSPPASPLLNNFSRISWEKISLAFDISTELKVQRIFPWNWRTKSTSASSGNCFGFGFPSTRPWAQATTSCFTPLPSLSNSRTSNWSSLSSPCRTVTLPLPTDTLPFSQAIVYSLPDNVVPKETENVPEIPEAVVQMELRVSTGARWFWRRAVKADTAIGFADSPSSSRVAAVKCTPPSRRNPPWCCGVLRHDVSQPLAREQNKIWHSYRNICLQV